MNLDEMMAKLMKNVGVGVDPEIKFGVVIVRPGFLREVKDQALVALVKIVHEQMCVSLDCTKKDYLSKEVKEEAFLMATACAVAMDGLKFEFERRGIEDEWPPKEKVKPEPKTEPGGLMVKLLKRGGYRVNGTEDEKQAPTSGSGFSDHELKQEDEKQAPRGSACSDQEEQKDVGRKDEQQAPEPKGEVGEETGDKETEGGEARPRGN